MSKINVNIEDLEVSVASFVYASKETAEINYRLKQLGNEFAEDPDLQISPEYEAIMSNYTNASNAVARLNEIFDSLLVAVIKAPEMYADAESENVDRINALVGRSKNYQKAFVNDPALSDIIEKAENEDININELADLVNKAQQSVVMSGFSMVSNENSDKEQ